MKCEVNLFEFTEKFPNEQACIEFLERLRCSDGKIVSPFSGGESYRISSRPGIYKCSSTRKNFSVRHGTIFEESRLPLRKWFFAIFLLHSLKKGISSIQIARTIGVTQKTAWFMLHRIRYAVEHENFSKPLRGTVEIDEHYPGGSKKSGKRGRGAENKTPILGILERESGKVHCEAVPNCQSATLTPIIRRHVSDFQRFADSFGQCYGRLTCGSLIG